MKIFFSSSAVLGFNLSVFLAYSSSSGDFETEEAAVVWRQIIWALPILGAFFNFNWADSNS